MLSKPNYIKVGGLAPDDWSATGIKTVDSAIYNGEIERKDRDRFGAGFPSWPLGGPGDWERMHKLRCQQERIEYARGSATRRRIDGVDSM